MFSCGDHPTPVSGFRPVRTECAADSRQPRERYRGQPRPVVRGCLSRAGGWLARPASERDQPEGHHQQWQRRPGDRVPRALERVSGLSGAEPGLPPVHDVDEAVHLEGQQHKDHDPDDGGLSSLVGDPAPRRGGSSFSKLSRMPAQRPLNPTARDEVFTFVSPLFVRPGPRRMGVSARAEPV